MRFIDKLGDILAKVFHPVFLVFYFTFFAEIPDFSKPAFAVLIISLVLTVLVPLVFIYFRNKGDILMHERKSRPGPLLFTAVCYLSAFVVFLFLFHRKDIVLFTFTMGLFLNFLVSLRYKISLHASAYGSITALMIAVCIIVNEDSSGLRFFIILSLLFLLIIALVLRQRFTSGAHTPGEIIFGFLSGFLLAAGCLVLYLFACGFSLAAV